MVLQVRTVHEKLTQRVGSVGHLHAENPLDGQKVGHRMARRTDAANARRDVRHFGEASSTHHALEQARRLDNLHLDLLDLVVLDDDMHVAVALNAGDMVDVDLGFHLPLLGMWD